MSQGLEVGRLVRLLAEVHLSQDQTGGVLNGREQVDCGLSPWRRRAGSCHRHSAQVGCTGCLRAAAGESATHRLVQGVAVDAGQQAADCRLGGHQLAGHQRIRPHAGTFHYAGRGIGDPLTDNSEVAPISTAHTVNAITAAWAWRTGPP